MTSLHKVLSVGAAVAALGCSHEHAAKEAAAQPPMATEGTESAASTDGRVVMPQPGSAGAKEMGDRKPMEALSDSEIVHITDVVNGGEIAQAEVAKGKAATPQVKMFADHMIIEHGNAKREGAQLVKQEQIMPEDSSIAAGISNDSTVMLETLRNAQPGASFDALYMDGQIDQHAKVLALLDTQLIPSAQSPALRAELERARGMVARHLADARQIAPSLSPVGAE